MASTNYIYQTIHTIAHHPLHVEQHCRILEQAFMSVFFRPLILDAEDINERIKVLLTTANTPREVSVFVELRVDIEYRQELVISEISIYEGYSLRCITPAAEFVTFDSPFGHHNTSARREVLRFADEIAVNYGGEIAMECDTKGRVISASGGSIFGVHNRHIVASVATMSVEQELIKEVARGIENVTFEYDDITKKEITTFDELFIGDHYGVTSIPRCGDRVYMASLAEKIAELLAQPWW